MSERIAIVEGIRTPFCKASGAFRYWEPEDLGAYVVRELMARTEINESQVDELIFGNVLQPPHATNIARVISIKAGLPVATPAFTVNRNCASGLEAITTGANKIRLGQAEIIVAGGTESMSHFPVLFPDKARDFLMGISKAKTWGQRWKLLTSFRFGLLKPDLPGIADPLCNLNMGQTAEILSREFRITREDQDIFALMSQHRAVEAIESGRMQEEIVPMPFSKTLQEMVLVDDGPREGQTMEALAKLRPAFDKLTGTVSAGNSSQITDGAAAVLLMSESKAKELGLEPLGYLTVHAAAGVDPSRMGLGPVFAVAKVLDRIERTLDSIDLIELNEAFAAQVIACERAMASKAFAEKHMGRSDPVGEIDRDRLNVNGGAIALGHPVGVSGTRLTLTILKELRRRNQQTGLVTMCVGGGQGEAAIVEVK